MLFLALLGFKSGNGPVRMLGLLDSGFWAQKPWYSHHRLNHGPIFKTLLELGMVGDIK